MSLPVSRWRLTGVAAGTIALAGTSTAAYACLPDSAGATTVAHPALAPDTYFHADNANAALFHARVLAWEQHALADANDAVAALQEKVATLGAPSTITPRTAWKLKSGLAFVSFLQARLAALPATAKVDALQASLATLETTLSGILANAAVATPAVKAAEFSKPFAHVSFFASPRAGAHHCDGDGFRWRYSGTGDFRHHDGTWHR